MRLLGQKNTVDVDNKKLELERQYLEMTRNRQIEIEGVREEDINNNRRFKLEKELWDGEKTDLLRKMKELNRKIEEIQYDIKIVEE
jgi:hypothetical protein